MASKVVNTRIQLKSDTEANWLKAGPKDGSRGFVPLSGELIVYLPDDTHPFSRLKVGDGNTNVVDLPFIDAETINGNTLSNIITAEELSEAILNIQLPHKLTFGAGQTYIYDGSQDITVPVFMGTIL